jgi:hypothetical protein
VQKPLAHCVFDEHAAPCAILQTPLAQLKPDKQSPLIVQVVRQAPVPLLH